MNDHCVSERIRERCLHWARVLSNYLAQHKRTQECTKCIIVHDSIGTECVRCAWLRSVSDRVRLNVAFSACIKQKKSKSATQRLPISFIAAAVSSI